MARSYVLAVVFVIAGLGLACHASGDVSPSFTVMNYLPVEDFMTLYCHCVDVGGNVSTLSATVGSCIDKEFQTSTCPTGVAPTAVFCNFNYYQRNRKVSPIIITPKYTNVQVWTSTGPPNTYFQLAPDAVYGSKEDKYFQIVASNKAADWRLIFEAYNVNVMRDTSVGNGRSFR